MRSHGPIVTDLVLLGAGHAHLEVLRRFAMWKKPGVRLTLIAREPETLDTRMLPGLIRGDYTFDQAHIDLAPLAASAGARLVLAEATGVDVTERRIAVAGRPDVPFDLLSIDVGGAAATPAGHGLAVKPLGTFLNRLAKLEEELRPGARIAVVGGDAATTELALALARRYREQVRIVHVCDAPEPPANAPSYARSVIRTALVEAGVELVCGVAADRWSDGRLSLSDGSFLEAATVLWGAGTVGPPFLAASGIACDAAGRVRVDPTLRSLSHDAVFAAGDCAAIEGRPRPKSGLWAMHAGAPLAASLRRAADGRAPRRWRPRSDTLAMVGMGDDRALAWRSGLAVSGRLVWRWKDWMDRRRMSMYQEPAAPAERNHPVRSGSRRAKMTAEVLNLPRAHGADDAAVMRPPSGMVVVQSVDHFPAFIDDPFVFGEIAAAHALSSLHAMGAQPWTALAVAAVADTTEAKMRTELSDMLHGASRALTAGGCTLVGGHSGEAAEPALGFAVTGLADPAKLLRKSGLRAGDALVLTKPLGTGVVLAAHRQGLARAPWLQAAIASMRTSNAAASDVLRTFGASACTGVAGFGLAGHLLEMLRASAAGAVLWPDRMAALPGALELAAHGVENAAAPDNRRLLPDIEATPRTALLFDPQTSGGLLAGILWERVEACIAALHDQGVAASLAGVVEAGETVRIA